MSSVEPAPKPRVTVKKDVEEEEATLPPAGSEAPFNPRVVAAIIDACVAAGVYIVFVIIRVPFLGMIANLGYWLVRDALPFLNGQSVGKKAMKLRAVTIEGKSLSGDWKSSAIRNLSLVIPFLNLVDLYLLWQKSEQGTKLRRLGDDWAKTKVIVAAEEIEPVVPTPP